MREIGEQIGEKELHHDAQELILQRSEWFFHALTNQAKLLADVEGHDVVLVKHVRDACGILLQRSRPRPLVRDVVIALAGVFAGVGVPLMITEATREHGPSIPMLIIATFMAVSGLLGLIGFLALAIWQAIFGDE